MFSLLRAALIAFSLGLDVFAVSVGVGMRGLPIPVRFRIGVAFTAAELSMTLIGIGIGRVASDLLGPIAGDLGFGALVAVGIYMLYESLRKEEGGGLDLSSGWGLFLGSLSISLDSLGVGFSILYIGVPLPVMLSFIAIAAASSTALGLAFGRLLGKVVGERAGQIAGLVLIATGLLFAYLRYRGIG